LIAAATRSGAETLLVAVPLGALFWLSGEVPLPAALGAMVLLVLVVMASGRLLLRAGGAQEQPAAASWVAGIFGTGLAVYALTAWFQLLAATAFALWAALVLGASLLPGARAGRAAGADRRELVALALCGAVTVLWCREIAQAPQSLAREGLFAAWVDYFIHGSVISSFGDPRAAGRQAMELAGFPLRAYHFASYAVPAALAAPLDLPGLPLATSVWLPLGFFTMCAGAYALGSTLAGAAGGVAAVAAVTMLPDASNYGLRNGSLSFHWYVLASPGACYGIGLSLLGFALLRRWTDSANTRALLASAALAAGTAFFRVHVFLVGLPAWLAGAALATRFVQRHKIACFGAATLAFALFVTSYYEISESAPVLEYFLKVVHGGNEPTAYPGLYQTLLDTYGAGAAVPVGVLLVLGAGLGVFLLYPLLMLLPSRSPELKALDAVPLAAFTSYVLLMLTAPISPFGFPHELAYSPFVLPYAALAVWSAATLVDWFARRQPGWGARPWPTLLLVAVLALPVLWARTPALAAPKMSWGAKLASPKLEPGLVRAAAFLRRHSRPGQVFAMQGLGRDDLVIDAAVQLSAMTGMAAYLARPAIHLSGGTRERIALERLVALGRLKEEESPPRALERLRELGIAWYVVPDGQRPRWDPERRHAVFASGGFAVYSAADLRQPGR
jgi:hypothetical protein